MIKEHRYIFLLAMTGFSLTLLCAIAEIMSGLGTKWGLWDFRAGLGTLRLAAYGETAAVLITIVSCIISGYRRTWDIFIFSVICFIAGVAAVSVPLKMYYTAQSLPAIHDITTDTETPPQFNIILGLRKDAPNTAEYGGPGIRSQQLAAYPDIKPVMLAVTPAKAFELCLATAREMGWDIINADPDKGIIEGTDTTFWFGFKDDIVIRIVPSEKGSRIDLRSVSRVGKSDVGTNAKRIRNFINKLVKKS
jgi:uncharacterized protein (DUF1499 family)